MLDCLETTIKYVDATRAAVIGHSRSGKIILWASTGGSRFAMAISNNSGCMGGVIAKLN